MNQQLHPPSQSDPLLHDLCRTPFSWNGAWRSRFGKSKRLSEMHLATISPHPRSPSPSPRPPLFLSSASNTHGDRGVIFSKMLGDADSR